MVCFVLDDGEIHVVKRKFYGRRKARAHARLGWKGLMFVDMTYRPIQPREYILLNVLVTKDGAVVPTDGESNVTA